MDQFAPTARTTLRRKPDRARYDRAVLYEILDAAPVCHVGFVDGATPVVIPTIHARIDDDLYLHGSPVSRMLTTARDRSRICVTATILDALVLARSALHHSMNYRSAVVFGEASAVEDPQEKLDALHAVVEHVLAGRWDEVRRPTPKELAATLVLRVPIVEASAKVRNGPPIDDEADLTLGVWAGQVPLSTKVGDPVADELMPGGVELPASVVRLRPAKPR
jgi:nitroimidazol reductase NimA-like FMN-containing flavoprotein (pyridoxamine 5'-phosphate oxidase superfamily)